MANIKVVQSDGQTVTKNTEDVTVAEIQNLVMLSSLPAGDFDHMIRLPAANGMVKTGAVSHAALIADAISAVNVARSDIVSMVNTSITNLQNGKMDKPTGTTTQYIRGDGSVSTFPTIPASVDISGKSDKSQFSALASASAHGQTNGQTNGAVNNPTNAPTDAPTNYGLVAAILGADINTTNSKQNQTASNVNTIATNLNALATKYNELATKFNALISWLGTTTTTGLTGNVNALRVAGAT